MNLKDALSGRAGLPGVLWVLRWGSHRSLLRPAIGALLVRGGSLGGLHLRRAKFKPGRKLTAYYDVETLAPGGERSRRPIAVTWPADGGGAEHSPASTGMEAEARRARLAAPFAQLQSVLPGCGLRILVSPLDTRFSQLVRVSDPRHVRDMLAEAGPASRGAYRVSVVRYRPGQRHVLRYDPVERGERPRPRRLFVKLYQDGEARQAFRLATAIANWLAEARSPVTAAVPFRHVEADDVVLYAEMPGVPLSTGIVRRRKDLAGPLRHAGEALRVLQGATSALGGDVPLHRFETEIETIARTSQHVHALLPEAGAAVRAILDGAVALHERLSQEPPAFAHGDYKTDHLFADGERLTLIDFNTCARADPAFDVGKLLADLRFWYVVAGRNDVGHAQRVFLDGYGPVSADRMRRTRLYEALVLTKIAAHRLPVFSPTWGLDTTRLVGAAHALVKGLIRDVTR